MLVEMDRRSKRAPPVGSGVRQVRACTVSRWSGTHDAMTVDFRFAPEVEAFRHEVRVFLEQEMAPEKVVSHGDDRDLTGLDEEFERALLRKAGARGFLGVSLPTEWGGGGRPAAFQAAFNLEVAAHDAPLIDTAVTLAAQPLVAWGSPDQRAFFLPRIIAGELIVCIAYTEPDAGSDLGNLVHDRRARRGRIRADRGQSPCHGRAQSRLVSDDRTHPTGRPAPRRADDVPARHEGRRA